MMFIIACVHPALAPRRNMVFNISTLTLEEDESSRIVWASSDRDSSMCFSKGKSEVGDGLDCCLLAVFFE